MKLVLLLENEKGRDAFLSMAADALPVGERIVKVSELRGEDTLVLMLPCDASAELVARETPMIVPGGFTALVSYYRVRDDAAVEVRLRGGREERREVTLAVATA